MKVLSLGGAGDMGKMAVAALLSSPRVSGVTIADKSYELAQRYIQLAGSYKVSAVEIDITDENKLRTLIASHDLVVNTIGPFYKFGVPVLKAAIQAKKNYVDICDDWKPTLEMLQMSEAAKAAGITAIIGIGASPGMTNLLAVLACAELDDVDEVTTAWGFGNTKMGKKLPFFISKKKLIKKENKKEDRKASAALLHLVYEAIGKVPTFQDGKLTEIEALKEAEPLVFPGGGRPMYACHIGHPEPVTLSRTLKAKNISNQMFLTKRLTTELRNYIGQIEKGQMTAEEVAIAIEDVLNSLWAKFYILWTVLKRFFKFPPMLIALAKGLKNNQKMRVATGIKYQPYGEIDEGMDGLTAVPMVVAAEMLLDGKVLKKGVLTPEESLDPEEFFSRYAKYCRSDFTFKDVVIKKIW
ncbi:MAG TPA: saccharopine dehydrogenase NADP-binding domain-containing protein [Candidatus Deferrimicrobium sp.]|nr:saccharopine dehydrogenase NADP-binding domain-containing protein [Candidatus Deferrimicrobium sp.]